MVCNLEAKEAVTELFHLYANDVYRYALLSLVNDAEAKDVVQEVFIRVLRNWVSFRNESSTKTWILSIARNYITDLIRKRKVEVNYQRRIRTRLEVEAGPIDTLFELEDIIAKLKPSYRQVIILRIIQDFSVQDTAKILDWPGTKVRITLHRAIKRLRFLLENQSEELEIGVDEK